MSLLSADTYKEERKLRSRCDETKKGIKTEKIETGAETAIEIAIRVERKEDRKRDQACDRHKEKGIAAERISDVSDCL